MNAVNESTIKGYTHPSISSKGALHWTLQKIVLSNTSGFKILFLHVQVPDEDVNSGWKFYFSMPTLPQVACEAWLKKGIPRNKSLMRHNEFIRIFLSLEVKDLALFREVGFTWITTGDASNNLYLSEFCVKHAECPVITIKRSADDTPQDPVDD